MGPLSSLVFSSRLLGLDPSLPSRGFDGVAGNGGAPDAAAAAVLEDGRGGGGASPVSLVRETIVCVCVWTRRLGLSGTVDSELVSDRAGLVSNTSKVEYYRSGTEAGTARGSIATFMSAKTGAG